MANHLRPSVYHPQGLSTFSHVFPEYGTRIRYLCVILNTLAVIVPTYYYLIRPIGSRDYVNQIRDHAKYMRLREGAR